MVAFETIRSQLLQELATATRGLTDLYVRGVRELPALDQDGAADAWLYALAGGDGTGGLILEARIRSGSAGTPEVRAAWDRARGLMVGLREVLFELVASAKASCADCDGFRCSACDGTGAAFEEARAA